MRQDYGQCPSSCLIRNYSNFLFGLPTMLVRLWSGASAPTPHHWHCQWFSKVINHFSLNAACMLADILRIFWKPSSVHLRWRKGNNSRPSKIVCYGGKISSGIINFATFDSICSSRLIFLLELNTLWDPASVSLNWKETSRSESISFASNENNYRPLQYFIPKGFAVRSC